MWKTSTPGTAVGKWDQHVALRHFKGKYTFADGEVYHDGEWENGQPVWNLDPLMVPDLWNGQPVSDSADPSWVIRA